MEFERAAFPPPGDDSPWVDGDDPLGHDEVRRRRAVADAARDSDPAVPTRGGERNPLAIRPDLPWLGKLKMPDLPVRWDESIIDYLVFWKDDPRGRRIMGAWVRDANKYREMIVANLRNADLPEDLLYVAMIESSFDSYEYSRVGASGLWQFMPAAARVYGLEINRWVDERNDPVRSTEAVLYYWKDLYARFGNWDLALAAYNAGYGAVLKSISMFNTNDFWRLQELESGLPYGTKMYVAKALAAAIVGRNPKIFGFDKIRPTPQVEFETVEVPTSVALSVVARAAGTSTERIQRLNPHVRRKRTPPGQRYVVRIPPGTTSKFASKFPQLRGDWDDHDAYVMRHGERFEDIAMEHGLTSRALAQLNDVRDESEVHGGSILVVPRVSEDEKHRNRQKANDDLYASGVPRGEIGEPLIVAVPDKNARVSGKKHVFYRVVDGDSLWAVSQALQVKVDELARWNGLEGNAHLHPRMVLQAWVARGFKAEKRSVKLLDPRRIVLVTSGSEEHVALAQGRLGRQRRVYTVKYGGTYEDVGKLFGLSRWDVARINGKPANTRLKAGDTVLVYEAVDPTRSERAAEQAKKARRYRRKSGIKVPPQRTADADAKASE